jgi:RNA polymerase-binding transcription factor DksA
MAVKKKPAKPAAKKASKPVKKAAPAKKAIAKKPVAKKAAAKPAAKKPAVKAKPAPAKKAAAKPAAKPVAKPAAKPVAKATPKPAPKPAPKVVAPVKKAEQPKPVVVVKEIPKTPAKKMTLEEMKKEARKAVKAAEENIKPVKTTVKTAVKYNPEFTKSVLDAELAEFRELIQRKLDAAKKELAYLQGLITRKDEMGGDEAENRYMTMEDGSISMEREQLAQMASRQITYIDHLEKALMRIENKTYGICRVTGKLIDKARLRAVPHATLSIEAKMGMVK